MNLTRQRLRSAARSELRSGLCPARPACAAPAGGALPPGLRATVAALVLAGAGLVTLALTPGTAWPQAAPAPTPVPTLATAAARAMPGAGVTPFDGVVEALRQTTLAAQVSGAIVELTVKAGDRVAAGQLLMRIDPRTADQAAAAGAAQVRAAEASLAVARKELERQRQLFDSRFISAAALDRARAEFDASKAQVEAQAAQAGAARTQSGLHLVRAPYAGLVAEVPVMLGDTALPGRPLVTLYDPKALRVSVALPQTVAAALDANTPGVRLEIPALPPQARHQTPRRIQLLPAADAATHTVTLHADLPAEVVGAVPGQFARVWLPGVTAAAGQSPASPWVPREAIVRRAELTGLYVLDAQGRPLLRQVRLGRANATHVEVLSGLRAEEQVALDPQAAARLTLAAR
jgi:RND family efflux transporter MFP subunit